MRLLPFALVMVVGVTLPSLGAAQGAATAVVVGGRPEFDPPVGDVGVCHSSPVAAIPSSPMLVGVKTVRTLQIINVPTEYRTIAVLESETTKSRYVENMSLMMFDLAEPVAFTRVVMIDSTGAMFGTTTEMHGAGGPPPVTRADTAALAKQLKVDRYVPDSVEQRQVRALMAWFEKRCPLPKS